MSSHPSEATKPSKRPGFRAGIRAVFSGYGYLFRTLDLWPGVLAPIGVSLLISAGFGAGLVTIAWRLVDELASHEGSMYRVFAILFMQIVAAAFALMAAFFVSFTLSKRLSGGVLERIVRRVGEELGAAEWSSAKRSDDFRVPLQHSLVAILLTTAALLPLIALSLILPPLVIFTLLPACVIMALAIAWEVIDYTLALRSIPASKRIEFVWKHFRALVGFAFGLSLLVYFPLTLLFVLPASVIGTTHLLVGLEKWDAEQKPQNSPAS